MLFVLGVLKYLFPNRMSSAVVCGGIILNHQGQIIVC